MLMESFDRSKISAKNIQHIIGNYNALAHAFLNKWVAGKDETYLIKAESAANNSFEILTRYRDIKPGDPAEPDETVEDIQHLIKTYDRLAYPFRNKWLKEKDKPIPWVLFGILFIILIAGHWYALLAPVQGPISW